MNRRYFFWIIILALAGLLFTLHSMWQSIHPPMPPQKDHTIPPPRAPFTSYISAVGIVEPSSDNISIGTPVNRIIEKVFVTVGEEVNKGDVLFELENQDLKTDFVSRKIAYHIALANLKKLEELPRKEDVEAAEAEKQRAQIELNQAKDQAQMVEGLQDTRAMPRQEINRRQFNLQQVEARLKQAEANLNKIKAGTWKTDIQIARLEAEQAKVNVERIKTEINRTVIQSPIDGKILQVRIHAGEYPGIVNVQGPLMVVGDTDELFLKVSINQYDAPFFQSDAPAVAYLRGTGMGQYTLEFVRLEPYLVSKRNLTNEITERVDTRVLQVVYRIKNNVKNIFVGQQMDVFIEAEFSS